LPDEAFAAAAGRGPFTLPLVPGATGTRNEVGDDDVIFDEFDGSQTLMSPRILTDQPSLLEHRVSLLTI